MTQGILGGIDRNSSYVHIQFTDISLRLSWYGRKYWMFANNQLKCASSEREFEFNGAFLSCLIFNSGVISSSDYKEK